MIKAIAFDFDFTLYDRDKTWDKMTDGFMNYFKEELREDVSREEVHAALRESDRKGVYEGAHFRPIYARLVKSGIFQIEPGYDRYYYGYIENAFPSAVTEYDDTIRTLDGLREKGYKVGVLTNGPSKYQRDKLNNTDILNHVDALVVGGDLPKQKPHRIAFEAIANKLDCELEEIAYVGDHPHKDMDGARQCGMTPIWMRSVGTWLEEIEPVEKSINRLSDLLDLMPDLQKEV